MVVGLFLIVLIVFLLIFVLLFGFYRIVFLRDPEREVPSGNNIVSPADGKVIKVIKLWNLDSVKIEKGLAGRISSFVPENCKEGYLINIMMDIFNVHVQRAPIDGRVRRVKHSGGNFRNAVYGDRFKNGLENEKNEILIENDKIGKFKVIQIAGFLARRIECSVKEKQKINKGERIGRILMGSQVSLILPGGVRLSVNEGDKVRAGETILGNVAG